MDFLSEKEVVVDCFSEKDVLEETVALETLDRKSVV